MNNLFCALGGGNHIGASCYYLQVDGHAFLLDCGIRSGGRIRLPDFSLLTRRYLDGLWQLDQIVLSHAHLDHVGALPYLDTGRDLSILCNPITQTLTEMQLRQFDPLIGQFSSLRQKRAYETHKERVLGMLQPVSFGKTYRQEDYRLTLFPAGHIPGAAMTYLETAGHRILYSGDFSCQKELLCGSYHLPENLPVDVLIVEGTHAYAKDSWQQAYRSIEKNVVHQLQLGKIVTLETRNVTKGIELARYLCKGLRSCSCKFHGIYLAPGLILIAAAFEKAGYQVYSRDIRPLLSETVIQAPAVIIRHGRSGADYGPVLDGDAFTLHADCQMLTAFINQVQAETTLIVHAQPQGEAGIAAGLKIDEKACLQAVDGEEYQFA